MADHTVVTHQELRPVIATCAALQNQVNQALAQIYDNRSHSITQIQMLEAILQYLERDVENKVGTIIARMNATDETVYGVRNQMQAINQERQTVLNQVLAIAGQMAEMKQELAGTCRNVAELKEELAATVYDVACVRDDMVGSHKYDFAHQIPFEILQADVREIRDQVREQLEQQNHKYIYAHQIPFEILQADVHEIRDQLREQLEQQRERQAEDMHQSQPPNEDTGLGWQLRNLKGRVTHLESNSSYQIRALVNALVQGQQRLDATVADLGGAFTGLKADLASRGLIGPNPDSFSYNSNESTAITTPSPINNNAFRAPVSAQHSPRSPLLVADADSNTIIAATNLGNYQSPTVTEPAEDQQSAITPHSSPLTFNPEAAPFAPSDNSTPLSPQQADTPTTGTMKGFKKFTAFEAAKKPVEEDTKDKAVQEPKEDNISEDPAGYKTKEPIKDSAEKGDHASKALAGIVMKNGLPVGLEGSMWAGKSVREPTARVSRAVPIKHPKTHADIVSHLGTLTLGDKDIIVSPSTTTESGKAVPAAKKEETHFTDAEFEFLSTARQPPFTQAVLGNELPKATVEDDGPLIPGLPESVDSPQLADVHQQATAAPLVDLLDVIEESSNLQAPVKPTKKEPKAYSLKKEVENITRYNEGLKGKKSKAKETDGNDGAANGGGAQEGNTSDGGVKVSDATSSPVSGKGFQRSEGAGEAKGIPLGGPTVAHATPKAVIKKPDVTITFRYAKMEVQAGARPPIVRIGHLHKLAFTKMTISLVIVIQKGQPMKLKIAGTVKGGDNDGKIVEAAELIIPMLIVRGTVQLTTAPAATYGGLKGEEQGELQALKDWVGDGITGNIHRLGFNYTAPKITDELKVAKVLAEHGAEMAGDQAMMYEFFTTLFSWEGGRLDMLFLDEDNDSQVVGDVLTKFADLCKN